MIGDHPDAALIALVDERDRATLGIDESLPLFSSMEALFQSGLAPDVVNIATPNGLHAAHALQALNAGVHVIIEKPMALRSADAQEMIRAAEKKQRLLQVVMQNRYAAPSSWIKQLVDSGRLGKIYMVQVNCFWNRDHRYYTPGSWHGNRELDGGVLFTQFSHFIDTLLWLFGDIRNITSKTFNFGHRDTTDFADSGMVNFDFQKGGMGSLHFTTAVWDKNLESSITVIAENGSVKLGGQYMNEVKYCHIRDFHFTEEERLGLSLPVPQKQNHYKVIANMIDAIRGEKNVATGAAEGMKVVEVIERIYAAAEL